MSWSIDPDTGKLVHAEGKTQFGQAEWDRQERPVCATCGRPMYIEPMHTRSADGREVIFAGRVQPECGHDPRKRS